MQQTGSLRPGISRFLLIVLYSDTEIKLISNDFAVISVNLKNQ